MKAVLALVISWIVLVPEIVTTAQTVPAQAGRMSVSYVDMDVFPSDEGGAR